MGLIQSLLLAVVLVIISFVVYTRYYLEWRRDIHELALNQQASISGSRKEDETAVYRSNQTPHGMPLMTGLQIRQSFRLRNGNLRDIWSVVMSQKHKTGRFMFLDQGRKVSCDVDNTNAVFKRLVQFFTHNDCYTVGVAVPVNTYHGFVATMACWTHGLTVHTFNQLPRTQPEDVEVLIISEPQLKHALSFNYKKIIVVSSSEHKVFSDNGTILNWTELGDLNGLSDPVYEYKYDPKYDEGTPLIDTHNFVTTSYTHQNFVSSVASIVKSLPLGHEFTDNERLLIGYSGSTLNYWPKIFAILLFGGSVIIGSSTDPSFGDAIQACSPTILAIDPEGAKRQLLIEEKRGWIGALREHRARHLLSEGIFTDGAMLPRFKSLKIVFIGDDGSSRSNRLSSQDMMKMRILCGARVIGERFVPGVIGSVISTNYYDYRVFSNDKLVNRGACSQSLEIKLFRYRDLHIEKRHGELCIRGFTIGKPVGTQQLERAIISGERVGSEGWMPTGVIGKFGVDGCFYED
ncbi:CYFA0S01e04280g1_1 [Cyberlindnera fabianii]|uniref:CYFA0S01e04280g1_1 n=1 Tax=Cyberlindnera fabianii TaxID=36022 RepID=A0A061AN23_CYBFA|nr:hypothetical protein BON22_0651 [Cyberlindnera fabianii]CDR36766.1 CYFA0S01e04280g1_1 [Cyberlindnera fabianii]